MRGSRKMTVFILLVVAIIGVKMVLFIIETRTPVQYAVLLEDVHGYPDSILVKETWHTGTGWEKVGDEYGLYTDLHSIRDVKLEGNMPPPAYIGGDHVNIFLCEVIPIGIAGMPYSAKYEIEYEQGDDLPYDLFEAFEVIDWHPIYPVKRYTVFLPSWFYPADYISKFDLKNKASITNLVGWYISDIVLPTQIE